MLKFKIVKFFSAPFNGVKVVCSRASTLVIDIVFYKSQFFFKKRLHYKTLPLQLVLKLVNRDMKDLVIDGSRLLKNEFEIFSRIIITNGFPQWNKDYVTGKEIPRVFYKKIKRKIGGAEIRSIWELNRLQFLPLLGVCYQNTGDRQYYSFFRDILNDWNKNNKYLEGVNWMNAMECSIRASNIILAFTFFEPELKKEPEQEERFLNLLYLHGLYIKMHLEKGISNLYGNHYLSDLFGLLMIGAFFFNNKCAIKWKKFALKELAKSTELCIDSDGIAHEHSTGYHKYISELYLYTMFFFRNDFLINIAPIEKNIKKMIQSLINMEQPDNKLPSIGDCDDGKIFSIDNYFDYDWKDLSHIKYLIRELSFEESTFAGDALSNFTRHEHIRLYKDTKILIYRNSGSFLTFLFWNVGSGGLGAHQHNDVLSFCLFLSNISIAVDPGTYCYLSNLEMRNYYRSTSAHNTISIDGFEINSIITDQVFGMKENADVHLLDFSVNNGLIVCTVENKAFRRLKDPVSHKRTIELRYDKAFKIVDDFYSAEIHEVNFNIYFDPGIQITVDTDSNFLLKNSDKTFVLKTNFNKIDLITYKYSGVFLNGKEAWAVQMKSKIYGFCKLVTEIMEN